MSQKLRFGTRERLNYRDRHVICRRTYISYDRLMQLDNERAHEDFMRQNELDTRIRRLKASVYGGGR